MPYRKQKTGIGYDSPTADGDVTNMMLLEKKRKSPFFYVDNLVSYNHIWLKFEGQ